MDLIARSVMLLLAIMSNLVDAKYEKHRSEMERLFFDHYNKSREEFTGTNVGFPNRRRTQLYSRNTGHFIQVKSKGRIVAKGNDGDEYADLEILTVSFGKVRIRGMKASLYICFDKRGRLIAKKRPRDRKRCIFREKHDKDAYTMYESVEFIGKYISFSRKGLHRYKANSKFGTKAVQFVERPRSEVIGKDGRFVGYYTSGRGKKGSITLSMMNRDKEIALKATPFSRLFEQNNPSLNPLSNGKNTMKNQKKKRKKNRINKHKKNRKNEYKKKKHSSKNSHEKNSNIKQQKDTKDNGRFPPRRRLGSTNKKD